MTAIALALAASLTWGVADYLGAIESRRLAALPVVLVSHAIGTGLLALAMLAAGVEAPGTTLVTLSVLAGLAQGFGLSSYYQALRVGSMGVVAPITATAAAVPVAFAIAAGERPGTIQGIGIALTVVGVALAAYERVERAVDQARALDPRPHGGVPMRRARTAAGVGFAVAAAIGIGLFLTGLGEASESGSVAWAALLSRAAAMCVIVALIVSVRGWARPERRRMPALVAVGVLGIGAALLFAEATTRGLLSVVSVIGAIYPLFTMLIARVMLAERLEPSQRVGSVLALAGVSAIVAG